MLISEEPLYCTTPAASPHQRSWPSPSLYQLKSAGRSGQWTTAHADATEALEWATENGQPGLIGYSLSMLARIEAARGERVSCQARVEQARHEVEAKGVGCMPVYNYAALGLAALSGGDLSDATANLQRAWDLSSRQGINNPKRSPHGRRLCGSVGTG
jgi:hypothetical protein